MDLKNTHVLYGVIAGFAMVICGFVLYITNLTFVSGLRYITYLMLLVCLILNAYAFSKANDGYVTFGNVFGSGFKSAAIAGVILVVWSIVSIYVFPEMKDKILDMTTKELMKNPKMTDESIEQVIKMTRDYWNVFAILGSLFIAFFWGSIFALLGAAIVKKKGERPFELEAFEK